MEVRAYLKILLEKWWLVLTTFLITFTATIVFTFTQPAIYQTTATFIVAPSAAFQDVGKFLSGLDVLSTRAEISSTYAEVATSSLIKNQAANELKLTYEQKKDLLITSQLRSGTNVFEIIVEGPDPVLVRDFTGVVSKKVEIYVRDLYEIYELEPLDEAKLPTTPVRPNKKLYVALGGVLGLCLGVGLVFLAHYLQAPLESIAQFSIVDDETGAYNRRYFVQRLGEEMRRAGRNNYPLSLALMNVDQLGEIDSFAPQARIEALHKITTLIKQYLREEDLLARFDGTTFAVLLADTPGFAAKEIMEKLQTRIAWTPLEIEKSGIKLNLSGVAGVANYNQNGVGQDELIAIARRAMEDAQASGYGQVRLFSSDEKQADTMARERE